MAHQIFQANMIIVSEKHILKLKAEKEVQTNNVSEQGGDNLQLLYRKIEFDFTKEFPLLKEYLVLYLPTNYNKDTATYEFLTHLIPFYSHNKGDDYNKIAKINNEQKAVKKFELKQNPEKQYRNYIAHLEFNVTSKDKEKNIITLETNYNIRNNYKYGFINISFEYEYDGDEPFKQTTFSFIINDNYLPCHLNQEKFDEISKYNLFSFNQRSIYATFRDKRVKINIENELNKELLSNFSSEEINKINNTLNNMDIHYQMRNLIYQKVLHNIKDYKNYTKIYDIVFYPDALGRNSTSSPYRGAQPIIVKKFKINNLLVRKEKKYQDYEDEDEEPQEEEESIDEPEPEEEIEEGLELFDNGYYISGYNVIGFYQLFAGAFGVYEFDCVSNERLDYFTLNCFSPNFGNIDYNIIYEASYKYEIILNGNKIDFPHKDFKYRIINDKILLEGTIDGNEENFNEEKYKELCKKHDKEYWWSQNTK